MPTHSKIQQQSHCGAALRGFAARVERVGFIEAANRVTAIVTAMTDVERPFLAESLNSIISDPGIAHVIVCVQDSNTWLDEVLASVPGKKRLEILRIPMAPAGAVRNAAVKQATTEWVAFCDGDDVWCPGKTQAQRAYAAEYKCDFVGCDHYLTDEGGRIRAVALAKYLPMTSTWMVRTAVMRQHPFREEKKFNGLEDHEWWFDTMKTVQKHRCPRLFLRYRVRAVSLSNGEPSKARKARAVALASIPVVGLCVLALTQFLWLLNRRKYYCRLLK